MIISYMIRLWLDMIIRTLVSSLSNKWVGMVWRRCPARSRAGQGSLRVTGLSDPGRGWDGERGVGSERGERASGNSRNCIGQYWAGIGYIGWVARSRAIGIDSYFIPILCRHSTENKGLRMGWLNILWRALRQHYTYIVYEPGTYAPPQCESNQ